MSDTHTPPPGRDMQKPDPFYGYGGASVLLHWLSAVLVLAMALSGGTLHVSVGIVGAIIFIVRVLWRFGRGFPRVSDQPIILNFVERMTIIVALLALLATVVSGALMPMATGMPYAVFGLFGWQAPVELTPFVVDVIAGTHQTSAMVLYAAIGVHLLAAAKHAITAKDGVLLRIVKPVADGK